MTENVIAKLTIKEAGEMTPEGRHIIADWLRHQARTLEEEGTQYSTRFDARYIVTPREADPV